MKNDQPESTADDQPTDNETTDAESPRHVCPRCSQPLVCVFDTNRPGWSTVMSSPDRPLWYDDG